MNQKHINFFIKIFWNANGGIQMTNFISTHNLGLKRKLAEQMKVYNLG